MVSVSLSHVSHPAPVEQSRANRRANCNPQPNCQAIPHGSPCPSLHSSASFTLRGRLASPGTRAPSGDRRKVSNKTSWSLPSRFSAPYDICAATGQGSRAALETAETLGSTAALEFGIFLQRKERAEPLKSNASCDLHAKHCFAPVG